MNIVIVGGGAVGMMMTAALTPVSDATLLVRTQQQADAIIEADITQTELNGEQRIVHVRATASAEELQHADVVVAAVKSYDTADVVELLERNNNRRFVVMSMQNGLAHNDVFAHSLDEGQLLLCKTGLAGRRTDTTSVTATAEGATVLGEPEGPVTERVEAITNVFRSAGLDASSSAEMQSVVWTKFAQACCQNAISAIAGKSFGILHDSASARGLLQLLSNEMTALAAAEGVALQFDPYERLLEYWFGSAHRSSMAHDVEAGRITEIDALNGEAVRRGARAGVPMPVNQTLALAVQSLQAPLF